MSSKLVIGISSSALFDLTDSDRVFRESGLKAYSEYQRSNEDTYLAPGVAFPLVQKLLRLNSVLGQKDRVEVILLSRNTADTGLRVFKSIEHHQLPIARAAFTGGAAPYRYMRPFRCQLFLSTNADDVREALANGTAAASILPSPDNFPPSETLHFAFDGDAVLFSDEAERIYQEKGLDAFASSERDAANEPLTGGPFKPFLSELHRLQSELPKEVSPIRTALVTARSAPAHERVIKTLRAWDIRIDESLFLGGMNKAGFLQAYGADVFFDDQADHCESASSVVPAGHVPHGVTNE
ncbi:MAG TPA: 5'-nucleotidase [Gammaproteobacteria bacterium]|nr:5'-nucleotidase [Gammaproteobacteria bacterium]